MSSGTSPGQKTKTVLLLAPCYDEPSRTMGSVPKIARSLAKRCRVVVFAAGSSDRVENRSKNLRVYFVKEWHIRDPVNFGIVPKLFSKLNKVLVKEKPDVVLNVKHMFVPNLAVWYLKRKGYRVVTATDAFPGISWWSASWYVNVVLWLYAWTLGLLVLKKSDHVILFHEALTNDAKRLRLRSSVIHNGVELEAIAAAKPKKLSGKYNVLYVGRLESVKGYHTILEAMQHLTQQRADVHFYHIGDDTGKEDLKEAYTSQHMHFTGRKTAADVYSFMKGADVIVLASKSEGLPNVLLEGMAAGCVPVSTPVGAVPHLLEGGRLGRLFSYGDAQALEKHVQWLLDHPTERKAMQKQGKAKIHAAYDWEILSTAYLKTLFSRREVH